MTMSVKIKTNMRDTSSTLNHTHTNKNSRSVIPMSYRVDAGVKRHKSVLFLHFIGEQKPNLASRAFPVYGNNMTRVFEFIFLF